MAVNGGKFNTSPTFSNTIIERVRVEANAANREIGKPVFSVLVNRNNATITVRDSIANRSMDYREFEQKRSALIQKYKAAQVQNPSRPFQPQTVASSGQRPGGRPVKHSAFIDSMLDYYGDVNMHDVQNQAKGRN